MGVVLSAQGEIAGGNRGGRRGWRRGYWGWPNCELWFFVGLRQPKKMTRDRTGEHLGKQRWNRVAELTLDISEGACKLHTVRERLKPRHFLGGEATARPMKRAGCRTGLGCKCPSRLIFREPET